MQDSPEYGLSARVGLALGIAGMTAARISHALNADALGRISGKAGRNIRRSDHRPSLSRPGERAVDNLLASRWHVSCSLVMELFSAVSKPNQREIALERRPFIARHDCTDVAIRSDQHPSAWFKAIVLPDMSAVVDDISARAEGVDEQTGARPHRGHPIHLVAQQSPMGTLKELEEAGRRSRSAANWRVGRALPGAHP
jgi:hypothetical protein